MTVYHPVLSRIRFEDFFLWDSVYNYSENFQCWHDFRYGTNEFMLDTP